MTSPRIRPLRRDNLDVEITLKRAVLVAPEVELGWSTLRQDMRDAGWPSQANGSNGASPLDYADPSGELAIRLDRMIGDLETLQDHWQLVTTSLRAMVVIARRHIPATPPAVPACSVTNCDEHVELTPNGGYRGMERIAGMWVIRPGARPLCAKHRTHYRRHPDPRDA